MIRAIKTITEVDKATFEKEILSRQEPVVIKSFVGDWPAVKAYQSSENDLVEYLKSFSKEQPIEVVLGAPSTSGKFGYTVDVKAFNFTKKQQNLGLIVDTLLAIKFQPSMPYIAVQGLSIEEHLPEFEQHNTMNLLNPDVMPRAWIGNKVTTVTHYDHQDNLACVVAGKRKFTLFPPEQVANLYVGPLLATPAGAPISLVDLNNPDLEKHPKFKRALASAQEAVLEPGDVIYIPYLWWHHVESLTPFNMLVNYWWGRNYDENETPYQCLLHSMLTIPKLPEYQRKIWRAFFDHYVFQLEGKPAEHLPEHVEDIISQLSEDRRNNIKNMLAEALLNKGNNS